GCAQEGADIVLNYFQDLDNARAVAREVKALGRRAVLIPADLRSTSQIERLFRRARSAFPRLDVLINNAGLTGWTEFFDTTEEKWDTVLDTNLKGTFFCTLGAARWMRDTKTAGSVINISTVCAALGVKNLVAYATSKAAINGMTKQLAVELAPYGIRVNTFAPGPINVERNLKDDPDYRTAWGGVVPLGRTGEPEEMVGPAVFLASADSSYVTGQVFYADGGWTVQGKIPIGNMTRAAKRNR
ncbi:MAG: SDR family oxidoreductase, partial [Opitutaceae bacterium]|nr:SDR family oxidoreductase [Opitutaceae bacterium]